MATNKLRASRSSNTFDNSQTNTSPVTQILQYFATGGGSSTRGLNPLADIGRVGADNDMLNAGMQSTTASRYNLVNQASQEALRRTENSANERIAKNEVAKAKLEQQNLAKAQAASVAAMQKRLIEAQQKAAKAAAKTKTNASPKITPMPVINPPKTNKTKVEPPLKFPKIPDNSKSEKVQAPKFPKAKPPTKPVCQDSFIAPVMRKLGLCR